MPGSPVVAVVFEHAVSGRADEGERVVRVALVGALLHVAHEEDVELGGAIAVTGDGIELRVGIDRRPDGRFNQSG